MSTASATDEDPAYKYWAFISYSQKDEWWAKRLHGKFETYALPKELVGMDIPPWGPLPKHFAPVFRDRDELSSSPDLGAKLTASLHSSRALVVLCSPHSANSRWVNEEIKTFKSRGREQSVFAIIVGGEPYASDAAAECFPAALRYRVNEKRELTAERAEPIAGDARKDKDGVDRAMLKTVAGILGVDFAQLAKREEERRRRRNLFIIMALAGVLTVVSLLGIWGWIEKSRAQRQATSAALGNLINEDPLKAALVLLTLRGKDDPDGALQAAIELESTPIPVAVLGNDGDPTKAAAFNHDGTTVQTVSLNGLIQAWNANGTGEPVTLKKPDSTAKPRVDKTPPQGFALPREQEVLAVSGRLVATRRQSEGDADYGREVFIRNAGRESDPVKLDHASPVQAAAFSADGESIVTMSMDTTAAVWSVAGRAPPWMLRGHTDWVKEAVFSPDGLWVLTRAGLVDGTVRVWPATNRQGPIVLTGHANGAKIDKYSPSATFSPPDGRRVATDEGEGIVRVWNADGHGEPVVLRGSAKPSGRAAFSPDGRRVVVPFADGTAWIWNADGSGNPVVLNGTEDKAVNTAVFSPDGRHVVTASDDGTVRVWNAAGGKPVVLESRAGRVSGATFSSDSTRIVGSATEAVAALVWNAHDSGDSASPVVLQSPGEGKGVVLYRASFSPDGRRVVTASADNFGRIWQADGTGGPLLLKGHTGQLWDAAFSPDGTRVVTASSDGKARVWDADTGTSLLALTGHTQQVKSARFSPDGQRVLTVSMDGTARLWDLARNRQLALLKANTSKINQAEFSPDGQRVVTAFEDGTARVWLVDWERLLERIAQRTTACLAAADRERYVGEIPQLAQREFKRCDAKRRSAATASP